MIIYFTELKVMSTFRHFEITFFTLITKTTL